MTISSNPILRRTAFLGGLATACLLSLANSGAAAPLRIMPVGDSITAGYTDNPTWNVPFEFGYRRQLYQLLTAAGYDFTFVGASAEPFNNAFGDPTHGGTVSPTPPDLRTIGQDGHRGYGGIQIPGITANIASYLNTDNPDIILLMIGINGMNSGSPAELATLVNTIFTTKPNVHLILAQITPMSSNVTYAQKNADLVAYNTYIRNTLVPLLISQGKKVSTVNQYKNFLTDPNNPSSPINAALYSNGINHPTNAAYNTMAQTWFEGILAASPPTDSDNDLISDAWELAKTAPNPNLNDLNAAPADFDNDGLSDATEYTLSTGAYPTIDPTKADTDGDTLLDGEEIAGAGLRPTTDPTKNDTDGDDIGDFNEDNTGIYVDLLHTGTDPTVADSDLDDINDGTEILQGTSPVNISSPPSPTQNKVSTTAANQAYASDVSTSDLLHGLTGTHAGWNLSNGADPSFLNDGAHGDYGTSPVQGAWTNPARTITGISTSTYSLPASTYGWDITSITTIADWSGGTFGNQRYTVEVRKVGAVDFITVLNVDHQPLAPAASTTPGGTKVTITRPNIPLATGVEQIRFTCLATNSYRYQAVYREFDVFGTQSTAPVIAAPAVIALQVPSTSTEKTTFTWASYPGKTYRVETSDTLSDWTLLNPAFPSGGVTTTYQHTPGQTPPTKAFFRAGENP